MRDEKQKKEEEKREKRSRDRTTEVIFEDIMIDNFPKKNKWTSMKTPTPSKAAENQKEKGKSEIITDLFNTKGRNKRREKGT